MSISIIICSYNPNREYLRRTVHSILSQEQVDGLELVIVDNRSQPAIGMDELPHDPRLRIVVEERPGLTPARIRGGKEARSDLLIFVDDDNILEPDYATTARRLADERPDIGVFSANITGEFERAPESWMAPYLPFLALTNLQETRWSHDADGGTMPVGAGMVVRREVMEAYSDMLASDSMRSSLDRDGKSLMAGGDTDIGYASLSIGLGCGWCHELRLRHLIPSQRLEPAYLRRIVEDVTASHVFLQRLHGAAPPSAWTAFKWSALAFVEPWLPESSQIRMRAVRAKGQVKGERMSRKGTRGANSGK